MGLLALYGYKEILNIFLLITPPPPQKKKKKKKKGAGWVGGTVVHSKIQVSDPAPSWPSCFLHACIYRYSAGEHWLF